MINTPHLIEQGNVRRTPPREERIDALERLVDDSAARIAFYEPIFRPALQQAFREVGTFSFSLVERALQKATGETSVPRSSLYASTEACVRLSDVPMCFMHVEEGFKREERERIESPQMEMKFPGQSRPEPEPKLRVATIYKEPPGYSTFEIAPNMRVPTSSVIYRAYYGETASEEIVEHEDQGEWETSTGGPLSPLPMSVSVAHRGSNTYALLTLNRQ